MGRDPFHYILINKVNSQKSSKKIFQLNGGEKIFGLNNKNARRGKIREMASHIPFAPSLLIFCVSVAKYAFCY